MSEILFMSTTTLHTSAHINEGILSIIKGTSVSHSWEQKPNSPILTWAWLTQDLSGLGSRLEDWSLAFRTLPKKSCHWQADLQKKNDQQRFVLPWELTLTAENKNSTGCVTTTTTVTVAQPLLAHTVPELTSLPKTHNCHWNCSDQLPSAWDFGPLAPEVLRFHHLSFVVVRIRLTLCNKGTKHVNWTDTLCLCMLMVYHSLPLIITVWHTKHWPLGLTFKCVLMVLCYDGCCWADA